MTKRALLILALSIVGSASGQEPDNRVMSLLTQDKNGLFLVMLIASPDDVRASATQLGVGAGAPKPVRYPRERFDELWLEAKSLALSEYISINDADQDESIDPSKNYLISIGNGPGGVKYIVPKCAASPRIVTFVKRLASGLLPVGSPGLFEPCPDGIQRDDG